MRCKTAREQLHRLIDGEWPESRRSLPALAGHMLTCRECRAWWRQAARLRREARTLPVLQPPANLRSRVLDSLPPITPEGSYSVRKGRQIVLTRLIGGMALTAGLTFALLTFHGKLGMSSAAEGVKAALDKVNTWHLTGWKLQNGKQVPWEIWGRRTPFFYREQVGSEITQDDGTQRTQVLSIVKTDGHPGGLVMLSDSRPGPENMGWTFVPAFQGLANPKTENRYRWNVTPNFLDGRGDRAGAGHNRGDVTYAVDTRVYMSNPPVQRDEVLTIDRAQQLPVRYEVDFAEGAKVPNGAGIFDTEGNIRKFARRYTTESLQAEYDRPLPANFTAPSTPPGYQVVDARKGAPPTDLPRESLASAAGLSVQATALAMDAQGDVLVRFKGWLGDVPLKDHSDVHLQISEQEKWLKYRFADDMPYADDQNRRYLRVDGTRISPYQYGDSIYMIFTPLEPPTSPHGLPHTLTLTMTAVPSVTVTEEGSPNHYSNRELLKEDLTWNLTLPAIPTAIDPEAVVPRAELRKMGIIDETAPVPLAVSADNTRADYYLSRQPKTDETRKADTRRCLQWEEQALAAAAPGSYAAISARVNVAYRAHDLGDNARAVQWLREALDESKRFPREFRDVRESEEKNLHDWSGR
jgi:hypothetical protein